MERPVTVTMMASAAPERPRLIRRGAAPEPVHDRQAQSMFFTGEGIQMIQTLRIQALQGGKTNDGGFMQLAGRRPHFDHGIPIAGCRSGDGQQSRALPGQWPSVIPGCNKVLVRR